MFGFFSESLKSTTNPVQTLFALNAKTFETLAQQQTELWTGMLSDGVKYVEKVSVQPEIKTILAANNEYASSVRERWVTTSRATFETLSTLREQAVEKTSEPAHAKAKDAGKSVSDSAKDVAKQAQSTTKAVSKSAEQATQATADASKKTAEAAGKAVEKASEKATDTVSKAAEKSTQSAQSAASTAKKPASGSRRSASTSKSSTASKTTSSKSTR